MTIRDRIRQASASTTLRSVAVLVGGTAFAHGITAAALPIVTRLYTPADFSVLAVFASLLSILSVAAGLRFDLAIPIPEHKSAAINLLALALAFTTAVASLLAIVVLTLPWSALTVLDQPRLTPWLWLLPIGVLLAGGYSALQMWFVRGKEFGAIARSRVGQSGAAAVTQIGLGLLHWTPLGLILGQMINTGAGCLALGYRFLKSERMTLREISSVRMVSLFSEYSRFPRYSTFEALANSASIQLPIVAIAALAIGPEAGFLILAMTAMQVPMGLIGTAVSQVYLSRAPDEHRAGNLDRFTTSVFGALAKSGVGPLVFAGIVSPALFAVIFGAEWHRAGILVAWMTPWFIMQFLSVPVSMALHVTGHQRAAFMLQLIGLCLRMGAVYLAAYLDRSHISEAYAISGFVFYFAYLVVVLRVVNAQTSSLVAASVKALPLMATWAAAGWVVALTVKALVTT